MAGLIVDDSVFCQGQQVPRFRGGARRHGIRLPARQCSSNTMTAVGLLGRQYLVRNRDNPMLTGGMKYLMNHLPDEDLPNIYYWYYANPGHAQHERIRVGHLDPQDARSAGPDASPQRR